MKVNCYNTYIPKTSYTGFKSSPKVETITHCNIGVMPDGIIGKVKVSKANGEEAYLNVLKTKIHNSGESYKLKDIYNQTVGEIIIQIKKIYDYDRFIYSENSNHIFISELRNYSNPKTPYHRKGLEEYKSVGLRLIQIAQRRSDECCCNGNIELVAKNESIPFYDKLGFKMPSGLTRYHNHNKRYLPPEAKEPLSKLKGGL